MAGEFYSSRHCRVCVSLEAKESEEEFKKKSSPAEVSHSASDPAPVLPKTVLKTKGAGLVANAKFKCSGCCLVVYCNKQHQRADWVFHRRFCAAVQKIKAELKVPHPLMFNGAMPKTQQDMNLAILKLKFLLRNMLDRHLTAYEEELTSFPAYCAICFSVKSLQHCQDCMAVSYCCGEHWLEDSGHKDVCSTLQTYYSRFKTMPQVYPYVRVSKFLPNIAAMNLLELIPRATNAQTPNLPSKSFDDHIYLNMVADFSCVATICYALSFLSLHNPKFVLFVVGADVEHLLWFSEQHLEFLFRFNPRITEMHIHFIGPEIERYASVRRKILGYDLVRTAHPITFEEFCATTIVQPSMIIAFNCGFSEYAHLSTGTHVPLSTQQSDKKPPMGEPKSRSSSAKEMLTPTASEPAGDCKNDNPWRPGVMSMLETYNVPIVFTAYTEMEAEFDYNTLLQIAHNDRIPMRVERIIQLHRNPYADIRPLRKWNFHAADEFYYRNAYIQAVRTSLSG